MQQRVRQYATKEEPKRGTIVTRKPKSGVTETRRSPAEKVLHLQKTIGNRAVTRLIRSGALQTRMKIGPANDMREKEAKRVANEVVTKPEPVSARPVQREEEKEEGNAKPLIQRAEEEKEEGNAKPLIQRAEEEKEEGNAKPLIQRAEEEKEEGNTKPLIQRAEEEKEEGNTKPLIQRAEEEKEKGNAKPLIQRQENKSGGQQVSSGWESRFSATKGGGHSLSDETRAFMEPRFGADFSSVRIHTGSDAVQMNRDINAQAFTVGRNIYFGEGRYNTVTSEGKNLLPHELTHTIQQGGAVRTKKFNLSPTNQKIQRDLLDYLPGGVKKGVKFIKGAVKKVGSVLKLGLNLAIKKIKPKLRAIPGYGLLRVIIGKDLVTGRKVPPTPKNLIIGLLGSARYNKLNKTGAIDSFFRWLNRQVKALKISPTIIWNLLKKAGKYFVNKPTEIFSPLSVLKRFFGPPILRIRRFIWAVARKIGIFILRGVLKMVGAPVNRIMKILNKGWAVLSRIINNPVRFARNLLSALKLGFDWFRKNFVKHLKAALANWLFGTLSKAGIELPKKFDPKGIFYLVAQILDLTYEGIKARIIKRLGPRGEQIFRVLETSVAFIKLLVTKGPIALWEKVKEKLANLKETVFGAIIGWVRNTIIQKAVLKILSMLNPVGALYQAAMAIYNTIMFFVNRWNQIKSLVTAIVNSVAPIVYGKIKGAAKWIEKVMARGLTVIISFLARLIGLGGISDKVREVIQKVRKPIDTAVDKVITWIIKKGKALLGKGKAALKKGAKKIKELIFPKKRFKVGNQMHTIETFRSGKGHKIIIKSKKMAVIEFIENARKKAKSAKEKEQIESKIDNLEAGYNKWKNMPISTAAQKEKKTRRHLAILRYIEYIGKKLPNDDNIPVSTIRYQRDGEGRAKHVLAEPLTMKGIKGSSPRDTIEGWYSKTKKTFPENEKLRRISRIRGHLLHGKSGEKRDLHGQGKVFNMTPISDSLNQLMYNRVEEFAIKAIHDEKKQLKYDVTVEYEDARPEPLKYVAKRIKVKVDDLIAKKRLKSFYMKNYESSEANKIQTEMGI